MNKIYLLLLSVFFCIQTRAQTVFINEIRADDESTDDGEFIEILGPAGIDVTGWTIIHVNGTGGSVVFTFTFPEGTIIPDDGIIDDSGQNLGFLLIKNTNHNVNNFDFEWGTGSLQNGPDGLILENEFGVRIQALSWNGLGDLSGGSPPWRNIGADANDDNSLCAPQNVQESEQSAWDYIGATPGTLNINQSSGDISLPVELISLVAIAGNEKVTLKWTTASEVNNLGFIIKRAQSVNGPYLEIAAYTNYKELEGSGNTSQETNYVFSDKSVFNGVTYWYELIDVDVNGIQTVHRPISAVPHISPVDLKITASKSIPTHFQLKQNYPNPFNQDTKIGFDIPTVYSELLHVNLSIYDLLGERVITLINEQLTSQSYELVWKGKDENGFSVPSGIYFYVFNSSDFFSSKKMVLVR
jgi:hypothetical protein